MINGVSFQPGSFEQEQQRRQSSPGAAQGVQEAIKVLSLRLPKVVGAQAVSPSALLQSPGSGGNSRVDSIVQSVLSRIFPTGTSQAHAPMIERPGAPSGWDTYAQLLRQPNQAAASPPSAYQSDDIPRGNLPNTPRVIVGQPPSEVPLTGGPLPRYPNAPRPDGDYQPPGMFAPFPTIPDLRRQLDWIPDQGGSEPVPLI